MDPRTEPPALQALVEQVRAAAAARTPLDIRGGNSKAFYGGERSTAATPLDVTPLAGITSYEPSELVVTALAGTPLAELEAALAERGQCLPFEPPRFVAEDAAAPADGAERSASAARPRGTVGGMVAAGLAGPARVSVGGVRDYVLGASLLNGRAELLHFGGTVMKNVAGYDVSRALAGSMGTLGAICSLSLKVLPVPPAVATVRLELTADAALKRVNEWAGQPLPLNASAWWDGMLVLRLAGARAAVQAAQRFVGGEVVAPDMAAAFWAGLRDHGDEFFAGAQRAVAHGAGLWRLSVPATTPPLKLSGEQLLEWHGAQRWICTSAPAALLREAAQAAGGHAVLFRSRSKAVGAFAPLLPPHDRIQRELMRAFDPHGIFNPGRLV